MAIGMVVLGCMFVAASGLAGWLLRERWVARRAVHQLALELGELRWWRWWMRNAAECTPLDPARPHMLRLALAAQLAPSLADFERDLHSLQHNPNLPALERDVAKGFLSEREVARRVGETPWDAWKRDTGKPAWNPEAQRIAYACALQSWMALFTRRLDEQAPEQPESPPEITH